MAEALNTVAYVINLSPVVALDGDVPDRVWFDKDVSFDHLKVFRCKACVHVPKDERSKLNVKTNNVSSLVMVKMSLVSLLRSN